MRSVSGDDADLAAATDEDDGGPVRFRPSERSDLARALGLAADGGPPGEIALDVLDVAGWGPAVNAVVVGAPPDRLGRRHRTTTLTVSVDGRPVHTGLATTVVVANGQFLHGCDAVPRGHPGDGAFEVQVYAVPPAERGELRRRFRLGTHLPHPGIRQVRARHVEIAADRRLRLEIDGHRRARIAALTVSLRPGGLRLLVGPSGHGDRTG